MWVTVLGGEGALKHAVHCTEKLDPTGGLPHLVCAEREVDSHGHKESVLCSGWFIEEY